MSASQWAIVNATDPSDPAFPDGSWGREAGRRVAGGALPRTGSAGR